MKKHVIFSIIALLAAGCCSSNRMSAVDNAKEMIQRNRAECVIVKNEKIAAVERGRGVNPLLKLYDEHREIMQNAVIVDKVIGRAAAFIAIKGNVAEVYGKIMSEDAVSLLTAHKIRYSYGLLVPRILNRNRDALCPLEASVVNINEPELALKSLRKKIAELRRGNFRAETKPRSK